MDYPSEFEAKTMICEYAKRVYARQFVAGNEGNLSCRVGDNEVWVTPTMESKGYLTPDMLVKLDMEGNASGKQSGHGNQSNKSNQKPKALKARLDAGR